MTVAIGLLVVAAAALVVSGVPPLDVFRFFAWIGLGVALPGIAWIQALRRRATHPAEDAALGLVLGYACVVALYLVGRAVGLPLLVLAWPGGTLLAVIVVRQLRPSLGPSDHLPASWCLAMAAVLIVLLAQAASSFWAGHPLTVTHDAHVDMAYHLALVGELRHHVPPVVPFVQGEPLAYHWLFYVEAAAASWVTGIEPQTLLYRLEAAPMLAAFAVLTALAVRRFTATWWAGPLAAALAMFLAAAHPYGWIGGAVPDAQTLAATWTSPTNTFGLALGAGVLLLLFDRLGPLELPRSEWLPMVILVLAATGAKASFGPVLVCGLLAVVASGVLLARKVDRGALGALAIAILALLVAVALLFGGTTGGVRFGVGAMLRMPVALPTGVLASGILPMVAVLATALLVTLVLWTSMWGGSLALVRDRSILTDPRLVLAAGMAIAAAGATLLLLYPGMSQLYYLRGATGILGILTAVGITRLTPLGASAREAGWAVAAAVAGAVVVTVVGLASPGAAPTLAEDHLRGVALALLLPVAALVAAFGVAWGLLRARGRAAPRVRAATALLLVAFALGFGLPASIGALVHPADTSARDHITSDDIKAAQWLRDHSSPNDLVATNLHCLPTTSTPETCDARHFWVSGYSERRVLVEGWAYTAAAFARSAASGTSDRTLPFWDPARLAANDGVFTDPTPANVQVLRDQYGVRWLFASVSPEAMQAISALAILRYRADGLGIFELAGNTGLVGSGPWGIMSPPAVP